MQNQLSIFDFQDQPVRILDQSGQPWFVAADVCRVLDLANPSDALLALDEDERSQVDRMTLGNTDGQKGGAQFFNIISESGLYALIFKSRKPEAKTFRKWVTSEVLPQIRATGRYEIPALAASVDADEVREIVLSALRGLRDGTMVVHKATAIFSGAKVFCSLRSDNDQPAIVPELEDSQDPDRIIQWMAANDPEREYTTEELREIAVALGIFPWLTVRTAPTIGTAVRFGIVVSRMLDRVVDGKVLARSGCQGRRRYFLRTLTAFQP